MVREAVGRTGSLHRVQAGVVLLAVAFVVAGCAMHPAGITTSTIGHGAALARAVVDDAASRVPGTILKGEHYAGSDDPVSCDGGVSHGSQATTSWDYGFAQRLAVSTPNDQLLRLLAPRGAEWKKTADEPIVTDGKTVGREVDWNTTLVHYVVSVFGESDDPRFALSGTTSCFNNETSRIATR